MNRCGSILGLCAAFLLCAGTSPIAETFRVAIGEWPPFITSKLSGFGLHTQKVTKALKSEGHNVVYDFLPWRRSLEMTKRGTATATFSWSYVQERNNDYLYSETPIDELMDVYFYRKDRFPKGLKPISFKDISLHGFSVVGISDYWYEGPLKEAGVSFQAVATEEEAWTMILHGRADIYIENSVVGDVHRRRILKTAAEKIEKSDPIRIEPLYILFTRVNSSGQRMLDIWEKYSKSVVKTNFSPAIR